ncbi:MAG: hypothetical protein AB7F35_13940 [Acetobacteraceae bacterium]
MFRVVLPLATAALCVSACDPGPDRVAEMPKLTRASTCQVGSVGIAGQASSTPQEPMTMTNDGGWCWAINSAMLWGRQYGPLLRLAIPPSYGEVAITATETETRIAYRPKPGFVGEDMFQTVDETTNFRASYVVTVLR